MTSAEFDAESWVEQLAATLPVLTEVQEPYLQHYWRHHPRTQVVVNGRDKTPFPLDDLCHVYLLARYSSTLGGEEDYAPLRAALNGVRHCLVGHPTLQRVAVTGRLIGDNDFWMRIPGSGSSISAGHLIAGLMARAAELPGDRFRKAARELSAFLFPVGNGKAADILGDLDEGCDMLLFYGLTVPERTEVAEGMDILPFGQARQFVGMDLVKKLAPSSAGFGEWRSVGAIVRPFRWRPAFDNRGRFDDGMTDLPGPFFSEAGVFLDLLAISHTAPMAPLATLSNRIHRSAGLLLGRESQSPGIYQSRPAQGFDGLTECPVLEAEAFEKARMAFDNRATVNFGRFGPFVGRLAAALSRNGRFAADARVLEIGVALEGMYELPEGKLSRELQRRLSRFLGTDSDSREKIAKSFKAFHDGRSNIAHSRFAKMTPFTNGAAFVRGFDLASQSLFKLLLEGPPEDWDKLSDGNG